MNLISRVDDFLLHKMFTPTAHYIDYRFHKNTYDVARWCLQLAVVAVLIHPVVRYADGDGWGWSLFHLTIGILHAYPVFTHED